MPAISSNLADALILVARADHYMVGITEPVTYSDALLAHNALVTIQNNCDPQSRLWQECDLALAMLSTITERIMRESST